MNKPIKWLVLFCMILIASACKPSSHHRSVETDRLFKNLKLLVDSGKIMFGMANPTTISYTGLLQNDTSQSDCKSITGSHPAFYESDFMWYAHNPDFKKRDIEAMKQAAKRGAVIGYCWHLAGMESHTFRSKDQNEHFTFDSLLVKQIIGSSDRNKNPQLNWFLNQIDTLVIPVLKEIKSPVVFRPFHEMNGHWFWWGSKNCTPDEYISLYRLVVDYLRSKQIDNVLWCWSPDKTADFRYYPGDDYVDILGLDIYEPGIAWYSLMPQVLDNLAKIAVYARKHDKVAALTETGCRKADDGHFRYPDQYPDFWTNYVLNPIINHPEAKHIAWIMSWYGVNWDGDFNLDFYIPYPGCTRPNIDKAIDDFKMFYNSPVTVFENDLPPMYR